MKVDSLLDQVGKDIARHERRLRRTAALHIKKKIRAKAQAMKVTGNLKKGVYHRHTEDASFVGTRSPAFHNYLIEFGHYAVNGKWVPAHPIVYPTFEEESQTAIGIMSETIPL